MESSRAEWVALEAGLARVDGLLRGYLARAGIDPRGSSPTRDAVAGVVLPRLFPPVAATDFPAQEDAMAGRDADTAPLSPISMSRLLEIETSFGLDAYDLDLLLLLLAPAVEPRYGRLYGYLQDDLTKRQATVGLILEILGPPGLARLQHLSRFNASAPLVQHALVRITHSEPSEPLIGHTVEIDPTVCAWLLGAYRPATQWAAWIEWQSETEAATAVDQVMAEDVWGTLVNAMHGQTVACFYGPDLDSQTAAARLLAAGLETPLLTANIEGLRKAGLSPLQAVHLALRDGRLLGAIVHLKQFDVCLQEGVLSKPLLDAVMEHPDLIVTTGNVAWRPQGILRDRAVLWQAFTRPSYSQRRRLWRFFLDMYVPDHAMDVESLAGQFQLTGGQIQDVVATARDHAMRRGSTTIGGNDLITALRTHSSSRLGELAYAITPRYSWNDLILPQAQTAVSDGVVNMVQRRAQVLEEWGVGNKLAPNNAVMVLFAGEPGTGKTMAAEVLASALGLDLYKVDLSSMVSKYIGETEKNLEMIFTEAERSNAILFFDEADAVFGKRSGIKDAHDRYANIGVSYLLQRMESYDGITILATNLRSNLDEAFTRRLHFVVDYPFPNTEARLRIWQALIPPELPCADDVDLEDMARRFKLAGGNIRNIIVSAAFQAADAGSPVTMAHLLEGARLEFQKMGRLATGERPRTGALRAPLKEEEFEKPAFSRIRAR